MTKQLFAASLFALLAGCSGGGKDTGETGVPADTDTDTDTDTDVDFMIYGTGAGEGVTGDCADGYCIYTITTTSDAGDMELDMTETGDEYLYTENHTAFVLDTTNADGTQTYLLELGYVTSIDDVVVNSTTLFNRQVSDGNVLLRTTWFWGAESADGSDYDCRVTGDDPDYYSDWCTYVVR